MRRSLLTRLTPLFLLGILSYSLADPRISSSHGNETYPCTERKIERLIEDLGSDRFEVRETAKRALMEMDDAAAALYKARKSADPEIRRRVEDILLAQKPRRARRGLARAKVLAKAGRVIEAVDRIVFWGDLDRDGEGWENLTQFADRVLKSTESHFPKQGIRFNAAFPAGEFRQYFKLVHPTEICKRIIAINIDTRQPKKTELDLRLIQRTGGRLLLRGEEIAWLSDKTAFGLITGIVAASADVQLASARGSVIIVGGDVKKITAPSNCVLVCDGDVELSHPPEASSLIIARGKVTCSNGKLTKCMVRSENSLLYPDGKKVILKDGTPDPVGFVKFFEFSDVGLTVASCDRNGEPVPNGICLKDVGKDSPFAPGLRAGDVVTALDETKVTSPEVFRRLLRRKLGQGAPILNFTVRRSGKTLDLSIPIKD